MKKIFTLFYFLIAVAYFSFSQNIGIGTTTPAFKLDVKNGSINTDSVYRIGGSTVLSLKGLQNTFVGSGSGNANTTGPYNTATGYRTLYSNIAGQRNSATGYEALFSNTTGSYNTGTGFWSLFSNTFGESNTAYGFESLYHNSTGNFNTANGILALFFNSAGSRNTAIGNGALYNNTIGMENVAVGADALRSVTTADWNTAVGSRALEFVTGTGNTGLGIVALHNTTSSDYNIGIGQAAGNSHANGSDNIFIGAFTDVTGPGLTNIIAMGKGTIVTASNVARFGNTITSSYGGWAGWTNVSDGRFKTDVQENVPGISFIEKLRPVTYKLKATELDAFYHQNDKDKAATMGKDYQAGLAEKEKITFTGFIAQEVETAAKQLGFDFNGVDKAKNENDTYGLRYAEFVVPLVKAVQEQQEMINQLKQQIETLNKKIAVLQQKVKD